MSAPTESRAFATIAYEVADAIATITLDRPEQLNALDPTMERELLAVWDLVDGDDAVRAAVVTGRGRAFCAGADLSDAGAGFGAAAAAHLAPGGGTVAPERVAENLATLIEHCAPQ